MAIATRREAFGQALRVARRTRGLSQADLAEATDKTQSNVSHWEAGRWVPEPELVFALERLLQVPAGFLSQHLGYVPVALEDTPPPDLGEVIMGNPLLDEVDKRALFGLYLELSRRR